MRTARARRIALLQLLFALAGAFAQEGGEAGKQNAPAPAAAPQAAPAKGGLEPVFPPEIAGLSFAEGEDAVSTNMAVEPTLVFGCSGGRSLQLSAAGKLPGDRPFYAEYVLRVEEAGRYELWYGGTPPGPRDEFGVSLSSPVSVSLDGEAPRRLYREDVKVVEQYAPAYYWVRAASFDLSQGSHVIRFEVSEKRRVDERWFFYLDACLLASPGALDEMRARGAAAASGGAGQDSAAGAGSRRLPLDPSSRAIDKPFRSVEDYLAYIQANPGSIPAYLELSAIYSLSGDYLSALKTLSRAQAIAPKDPAVRLLVAKNRIWRGDVKEGLAAYSTYLQLRADDLAGYAEAGKVAAWSGRYPESAAFYNAGLAAFPGELGLRVNLGLTQLWASDVREAERNFAEAERGALKGGDSSLRLAEIYRGAGYADRALAFYEKAIAEHPEFLALYLGESEIYAGRGDAAAAESVMARISSVFAPSARLSSFLAAFAARRDLKAERIRALEASLAGKPDDLLLREELTRVYFWNGFKDKAVLQLESILAARLVLALDESDAAAPELAAVGASASALRADAALRLGELSRLELDAAAKAKAAAAAQAALSDWEKRKAAAEAAAAAVPPPKTPPKIPPAAEGEALAASRDAAQAAFGDAVDALASAEARLQALANRAAALREDFAPVTEREKKLQESHRAIVQASGWTWDPKAYAAELAGPAARGEAVAAYGQARTLAAAGDAKAALLALTGAGGPALEARRRAADYALRIRADYREAREVASRAAAAGELLPGSAMEAAAGELALVDSAAEALPGTEAGTESTARLAAAQGALPALRKAAASAQADLAVLAQSCAVLSDQRVARTWRAFEEANASRRAELGAYYDGLGQAEKAALQYRRVLAVDPANLAAMYNLALAEDRRGDWRSAARLLRSVYSSDADYGNAASVYNRIERLRARGFDADVTLSADSNRLTYKAGGRLLLPISSLLALDLKTGLDSVRESATGLPAFLAGRIEAAAPISLASGKSFGLVLRPAASFIGTSSDYASAGGSAAAPADFLSALNLFTAGGGAAELRAGPFSGSLSYRWEPLPDTLNPSRFPLYAHRGELSAGAYLPMQGAFRYFAPRLYLGANAVPEEGNYFGTALLEAIPAFRLSDSPWTNLGIPLDLVYEDALKPHNRPYFAADGALTAKGGLLWQSTFAAAEGEALAATLQAMGGLYQTGTFSGSPSQNLYLQLYGRLEWLAEGATYWVGFEATGSGRFDTGNLAYWSLSLMGGASTKQPRLIAP